MALEGKAGPDTFFVETVTGPLDVNDLGFTLIHEHLLVGWPGAGLDPRGMNRSAAMRICLDNAHELVALGVKTIVDPCPMDLGRDAEFAAEVSEATGLHVILATGLYNEAIGFPHYFRERSKGELEEILSAELEEGIGATGIKPGVIKCGSGKLPGTPKGTAASLGRYELRLIAAAAAVSRRSGTPVMTHNDEDFPLGVEQLASLVEHGATPEKVLVGHSDGVADMHYYFQILKAGGNLGFDRFGLESVCSDDVRLASLLGLLHLGYERQLFISTDKVMCWLGRIHPALRSIIDAHPHWKASHIVTSIIPRLLEGGVSQQTIDVLTVENPKRFLTSVPQNAA